LVRRFAENQPHGDGWHNLLVWGDNLLALRELLADQQGPDRFGTRGKIKLIYIDPPFATRQDFMKDKEKAYRDKVLGAQFIEFVRRRLIILLELLAEDGSIYVHLEMKLYGSVPILITRRAFLDEFMTPFFSTPKTTAIHGIRHECLSLVHNSSDTSAIRTGVFIHVRI
jgi:hypothetical protein